MCVLSGEHIQVSIMHLICAAYCSWMLAFKITFALACNDVQVMSLPRSWFSQWFIMNRMFSPFLTCMELVGKSSSRTPPSHFKPCFKPCASSSSVQVQATTPGQFLGWRLVISCPLSTWVKHGQAMTIYDNPSQHWLRQRQLALWENAKVDSGYILIP